jgi:hypothetical protein
MLSKGESRPGRLRPAPHIRPEGGRKVTYAVPDLPVGKFRHCDGQLVMDLVLCLPGDLDDCDD